MARSIKGLGIALAGALLVAGCSSQEDAAAGRAEHRAGDLFCERSIAPTPGYSGWRGMAVDGEELFVIHDNGPVLSGETLYLSISAVVDGRLRELARLPQRAPKQTDGSEGNVLILPTGLLVDTTSLYFLQSVDGKTGLYKMPRAGGAPQKLAAADLNALDTFPQSTTSIARDESHVYFYTKGELARVPLAGGTVETSGYTLGTTL